MNWSKLSRQIHRWLSMAFTATVLVNFAVRIRGEPPLWVTYSPLAPLFLLLVTGLYLFVAPHAAKWRRDRSSRKTVREVMSLSRASTGGAL